MPSIIVHGGAGAWADADEDAASDGVARAAAAGWAILATGGAALDAVEASVRVLEDDPHFNAGYGAVLDRGGACSTDAAIAVLDRRSGVAARLGAVGAVPAPYTRHPVGLARRLLERGEHAFLVGDGVAEWARGEGFAPDPPGSILAPQRARLAHSGDTVGACAVDNDGRMAVATSTGGTAEKRRGRVGDTPLFGAGLWIDDSSAVCATGHGESIMRVLLSRETGGCISHGQPPSEAARGAIQRLVRQTKGEAGLILVTHSGQIAHFTSTRAMPWAAITDDGPQQGFAADAPETRKDTGP